MESITLIQLFPQIHHANLNFPLPDNGGRTQSIYKQPINLSSDYIKCQKRHGKNVKYPPKDYIQENLVDAHTPRQRLIACRVATRNTCKPKTTLHLPRTVKNYVDVDKPFISKNEKGISMSKEYSPKDGEGKIENFPDSCLIHFGDVIELEHATRYATNISLNICVNKTRPSIINSLLSCF